jgi:hypothetical protein
VNKLDAYVDRNTAQSKTGRVCGVACHSTLSLVSQLKPTAELNPICQLLALLGAHHILHVSRIRVNGIPEYFPLAFQTVINYFVKDS